MMRLWLLLLHAAAVAGQGASGCKTDSSFSNPSQGGISFAALRFSGSTVVRRREIPPRAARRPTRPQDRRARRPPGPAGPGPAAGRHWRRPTRSRRPAAPPPDAHPGPTPPPPRVHRSSRTIWEARAPTTTMMRRFGAPPSFPPPLSLPPAHSISLHSLSLPLLPTPRAASLSLSLSRRPGCLRHAVTATSRGSSPTSSLLIFSTMPPPRSIASTFSTSGTRR